MVAGHFFVEAIDLIIDSDLHNLNRDRDERARLETQEFLGEFGIDPSSRRLAQGLRSIRTMDREKASDRDKAEAFAKSVPNLIGQPVERIMTLIHLLENTVGRIDRELFSERTRLSTISTVTRPLSTKWLERWNTLDRPDFNYEVAAHRASEMLNREINDNRALQNWLAELYDMFAELVIYRGPTKGPQMGSFGRPAGMVGEGNERLYRRNWFSWIEEHTNDIMQKAIQLSSGDAQSAYSASYSAARQSYARPVMDSAPSRTSALSTQAKTEPVQIEVSLESATAPDGVASRTWDSKQSFEAEVAKWVTMIAGLWGAAGEQVHISVNLVKPSGPSSIKIPGKSASAAAEAAKSFVELSS